MTGTTPLVLSTHSLDALASTATVPRYDRAALARSIVHIGVGGFHRSHLATYVHEICSTGSTDWGIVGAGVLAGDRAMADALLAQDGLYSLIVRGPRATEVEVIGSIVDYALGYPDPEAVIAAVACPATQIVSLTVTEGGYPINDRSGRFDAASAAAAPGATFSIIAAGLERRRTEGGGPLTVLSCDNIIGNGRAAARSLEGVAAVHGQPLIEWIAANVTFPNSMVDRITPVTTDADRRALAAEFGIEDRWPVVAEPFRQWVVEDRFAGARLPLESLDVIVTDDVEPYEFMKLRLLNAGHSCLSYLAALLGIATVDAAMADPDISRYVNALLRVEAAPMLAPVAGIDIDDYVTSLIDRFSNPNVGDQVARLCLDGSVKFPKFLVPTLRAQLANDGPIGLGALALAGWCQYLRGVDERGEAITLSNDPLLDRAIAHAEGSDGDPARFLDFSEVFDDLGHDARFSTTFVVAIEALRDQGVRLAINAALEGIAADGRHAL